MREPSEAAILKRDSNKEARIQAAIVEWVRVVAPHVLIFAVPNGGLRTKAEAARLKWTGVVAGIPDLAIVVKPHTVFFMETKPKGESLSKDQRDMIDLLVSMEVKVATVRSIDDARSAFAAWGIQTREAKQEIGRRPPPREAA